MWSLVRWENTDISAKIYKLHFKVYSLFKFHDLATLVY